MAKQKQPTGLLGSRMEDGRHPSPLHFACPTCGTEAIGHFCSNCGEKELTDQDYSLRHYLKEIVIAVTLLESKVLRTVWFVLSKPGFLSSEYFRGCRVRYMKPLQLFVFLNVVYYFSLTLFYATTFTTPLATQLHMNNYYPRYASARVEQKLQKKQISYEELEAKYNKRTSVLSRTLVFLLIPIFTVLFYALFFKKKKYLVEHAVVATHFWSFNLLLLGVILPVATVLLLRSFKALHIPAAYVTNDAMASSVLQVCFGVYLYYDAEAMLRHQQVVRCAHRFSNCLVLFSHCVAVSISPFRGNALRCVTSGTRERVGPQMSVMGIFRQLRENPVNRVNRLHLDLRLTNDED